MLSSEFFPRLDFRSHFCRHPSSDYLAKNISPLINNVRSKYQMNTVTLYIVYPYLQGYMGNALFLKSSNIIYYKVYSK